MKLEMRGRRTTAASSGFPARRAEKREDRLSSSSRSRSSQGTTPSTGTPVRASSWVRPGRRMSTSPRNLLMMVPFTMARSSGSSRATVPYREANTPPRSMSPASSTGAPASLAIPMFTMSSAFRLISAGLPAPSRTMTSYSASRDR